MGDLGGLLLKAERGTIESEVRVYLSGSIALLCDPAPDAGWVGLTVTSGSAVEHQHDVGFLFNGTGLPEVGQLRLTVLVVCVAV